MPSLKMPKSLWVSPDSLSCSNTIHQEENAREGNQIGKRQQSQPTTVESLLLQMLQKHTEGFPGVSVVKKPSVNAGNTSSIPGPVRSHVPRATKPVHYNHWSPHALEPVLCNKRSHRNEKPVHSRQLEKSPHSNKDPAQPKWIRFKK